MSVNLSVVDFGKSFEVRKKSNEEPINYLPNINSNSNDPISKNIVSNPKAPNKRLDLSQNYDAMRERIEKMSFNELLIDFKLVKDLPPFQGEAQLKAYMKKYLTKGRITQMLTSCFRM